MNYIGVCGPQSLTSYDPHIAENLLRHDLLGREGTVVCRADDPISRMAWLVAKELGFTTMAVDDRLQPTSGITVDKKMMSSSPEEMFVQLSKVILNYGGPIKEMSTTEGLDKQVITRRIAGVAVAGSVSSVWFDFPCAYVTILANNFDNRVRSWAVRDLLRLRQYSRRQNTPLAVVSSFRGPLAELSEMAKQMGLLRLKIDTAWTQQDNDRFVILSGVDFNDVQANVNIVLAYTDDEPAQELMRQAEMNNAQVFKRMETMNRVYPKRTETPDTVDLPSQDRPLNYTTFEWEPLEDRVPYTPMEIKYPMPQQDPEANTPHFQVPSNR